MFRCYELGEGVAGDVSRSRAADEGGVEGEVDTLVDSPIPIPFTEQLIM